MSNDRVKINLSGVEKTLLMPLWGRAKETEKNDPLIVDSYAKGIIDKIDYSFLVVLILGIAFAFLTLARVLVIFLESYTGYTYAFFLGLIISSAFFIFYSNKKNRLFSPVFYKL